MLGRIIHNLIILLIYNLKLVLTKPINTTSTNKITQNIDPETITPETLIPEMIKLMAAVRHLEI